MVEKASAPASKPASAESLLKNTSAGRIAVALAQKDGRKNTISGETWNAFVKDKGGKQICNTSSISVENAMKSISTYAVKNAAAQDGVSARDFGKKWLQEASGKTAPATQPAKAPAATKPATKTPVKQTPSVKPKTANTNVKPSIAQGHINVANEIITNLANGEIKGVNITGKREPNGSQYITLPDGRAISIDYDEKGEISVVGVSTVYAKDEEGNDRIEAGFTSGGMFAVKQEKAVTDGNIPFFKAGSFKKVRDNIENFLIDNNKAVPKIIATKADNPQISEAGIKEAQKNINECRNALTAMANGDFSRYDIKGKKEADGKSIVTRDNQSIEVSYDKDSEISEIRVTITGENGEKTVKFGRNGVETEFADGSVKELNVKNYKFDRIKGSVKEFFEPSEYEDFLKMFETNP